MTKIVKKYTPNTVRNITWLWAVALLPIPATMLSKEDSTITFITILASFFITLILSILLPNSKGNSFSLLVPGSIFASINTMLVIDYWSEVSNSSLITACGTGFKGGNCFLADGMGIVSYLLFIPVFAIIANILFTSNVLRKSKIVVVKHKASKVKTGRK